MTTMTPRLSQDRGSLRMASLLVCVELLTFPTWLSTEASTTTIVASDKTTTAKLPPERNSFEESEALHELAWLTRETALSSSAGQCATAGLYLSLRLCQIPARSALLGPRRMACCHPLFLVLMDQAMPCPLAPDLLRQLGLRLNPQLFPLSAAFHRRKSKCGRPL